MLFSSKQSFWFSQFKCTKEIKFLMHWFYICVTTLGLPLFNPHLALYTNCVLLMVNCLLISTSIWLIAHLSLWFHISLPIITVLICNSYHFLSVLVFICIFKFAWFLVFIYEVTQEYWQTMKIDNFIPFTSSIFVIEGLKRFRGVEWFKIQTFIVFLYLNHVFNAFFLQTKIAYFMMKIILNQYVQDINYFLVVKKS